MTMRVKMAVGSICLGFFAVAVASPQLRVPLEPSVPIWNESTSLWSRLGRPEPSEMMKLTVSIRVDADRLKLLEDIFWKVSDPEHEQYGKHLGLDEIAKILAVPEERTLHVQKYFLRAGAKEAAISPTKDMISVTMPVSAAEVALDTSIHTFGHNHHKVKILRSTGGYSLPYDVAREVVMVGELKQFPNLISKQFTHLVGGAGRWPNDCQASGCKGLVTPGVLQERYKLPKPSNTSAPSKSANSMAVVEFQGQYYDDKDLKEFSSKCNRDVKVDRVIGGNQEESNDESELDIEYIKSVAPEIPLTVIYQDKYSLLDWANGLNSMSNPPLVASVSYGNDEGQQTSHAYMLTCNTAFMKAGVRGISVLFASGDQGVCGREGCGFFKFRFKPDFPAGSPYITSVGGTDFVSNDIGDEQAWQESGGGFSDNFPAPAYQKAAVEGYFKSPDANLPPQQYWNRTGRGYPDVSALGGTKTPYCVALAGGFEGVAGTSASCPVVAGVFAKLNGLRLAAGKPPMGFLNPFIYKNPSGFQDVTQGINRASRKYGFKAVKGWDPATGFGTPDFESLSKLAMSGGKSGAELPSIVV
eukprot:TRINITY_DN78823_c0_g1_i1.p1 TRINITY_DN78823_c0_g1~~TRINITY_DN78823_c0_g1_i1.p1  ORF type:complete len:584 (+),score=107.35 TRINITY_DN78823_c0_g1_i1:91-1842(+)